MILKELRIYREEWGQMKGRLAGEIAYQNVSGKIQLTLNEEDCLRLLAVVADGMVATSKTIANELTSQVINSTAQIEDMR